VVMSAGSPERVLTDAIIGVLEATGVPIGDGIEPAGAGWQGAPGESDFVGYVVVHPISGGITDGTIDQPQADGRFVYQLSCHGASRRQCQALIDFTQPIMLDIDRNILADDGWSIMIVDVDMLGGATRMDAVQPPQWWGFPRYRFRMTPRPVSQS